MCLFFSGRGVGLHVMYGACDVRIQLLSVEGQFGGIILVTIHIIVGCLNDGMFSGLYSGFSAACVYTVISGC